MLPFEVRFKPGEPPYLGLIFAVKKAIVSGQLKGGSSFPSVRVISRELRLNPNTVHKSVTVLVQEKMLEVRPGVGTFVTDGIRASADDRAQLLESVMESLVVEAKGVGLSLDELQEALAQQWKEL